MRKKNTYLLQNYVSRSESIRHTLSKRCFDDGIDTFFNHKVPFSYSTGSVLANRFCKLIKHFIKSTQKTSITLLELGAGNGKLSHEILSILNKDPQMKSITFTLLITDSNPILIKQMKTQYHHTSQIIYECFNPLTDSYSDLPSFDIAIMCYLLDCLDTYHLEINNGKVYEWKVKSSINKNDYLITSTKQKIKYLNVESLSKYILNLKSNESLLKLSYCIKESLKREEIDMNHDIYNHTIVNEILRKEIQNNASQFNLSIQVIECIKKLLDQLNDSQMAIIFDFGIPNNSPLSRRKKNFKATYGMCNFYSVTFTHLHYLAKKYNTFFEQTQFKHGESQCLLFHKKSLDPSISSVFKETFSTPGNLVSNLVFNQIKSYANRKNKRTTLNNYVEKKISTLSEFEKNDYEFNIRLSELLIDFSEYDLAAKLLDTLITTYCSFARSAYFLKAKLLHKQNKPKDVIILVEQLDLHNLKHSGLLYQYCLALCKCENYTKFETFFHRFIQHTDYFIPWRFFIILHYIFSIKHKQTKLTHLEYFLNDIIKHQPKLLSPEILSTFRALLTNRSSKL